MALDRTLEFNFGEFGLSQKSKCPEILQNLTSPNSYNNNNNNNNSNNNNNNNNLSSTIQQNPAVSSPLQLTKHDRN
jgi:hypothetical protein